LPAETDVVLTLIRGEVARREGRAIQAKVRLSKKRVDGVRPTYAEVSDPAWRGMHVDYSTAAPKFWEQSRDLDPLGCVGIVTVERESLAWKAGVRPGDFVSHVGQKRVATPREFHEAIANLTGSVSLRLTATSKELEVRSIPATSIPATSEAN